VRVTDGDTVVVRSGSGRRFKIRLIGIDTPEVFGGLECGARAASASMKRLAPPGRRVRVKGDPTQDRRDSFGRLLAYVKTRNGPQLNIAQVRRGHAKVFVFQGNPFRQTQSFRRAARSAKRARRGVWGRCGGNFHRRVRATSTATRRNCGSLDEGLASRRCGPSTQGAGPAATIAASVRECGDLTHRLAFNITSRAVACQEARRVVRRWNNTVAGRGGNGRVRGLFCRYRDTGYESGDIRCTRSRGRVVRWQTAS